MRFAGEQEIPQTGCELINRLSPLVTNARRLPRNGHCRLLFMYQLVFELEGILDGLVKIRHGRVKLETQSMSVVQVYTLKSRVSERQWFMSQAHHEIIVRPRFLTKWGLP